MCKEMENDRYRQVVAVTNRKLCEGTLEEQMERVCRLRPKAVILREKDLEEKEYVELARRVGKICAEFQVPLIWHSFAEAAAKEGVEAVHLPLWKLKEVKEERPELLEHFTAIGASVHAPEEAVLAESLGASYVTAGHVYATDCKRGLPPRGTEFLREVCRSVTIPVFAIGGIQLEESQIEEVLECGASGACIMSGMMKIGIC